MIIVGAALLGAGCGHVPRSGTDDAVVVGRVQTLDHEVLDEWGLNVQFTGRLNVTRVVSGRPPSAVLTIRYIAHSSLAADREFPFRLRRSEGDVWLVCREGGGRGYVCD